MKNITNAKDCLKCKLCCLYTKDQIGLAPYFSKREMALVDKKKIRKTKEGLYQAKVKKSKTKKRFYACIFLDEKNHKCTIYRIRPLDCITWPFIIGWNKEKSDVFLWISNGSFCTAVKNIAKIKKSRLPEEVLEYLKKKNFFKEIKNKERFLWPYEKYQVKLKKITKLAV